MPVGRSDTDTVWERVYKPVMESFDCDPVRMDLRDSGGLIIPQIYTNISDAKFIISDLTYERPNCYYETGYAIGLNKDQRLILCCRADHDLHRPPRYEESPKIHFDLQSYGIIWWNIDELDKFKEELISKLSYREKYLPSPHRVDSRISLNIWKRLLRYFTKEGS